MPDCTERRALVTGATGFIGRRLVRLLVDDGWGVHAVVLPGSSLACLPPTVVCHEDDGSRPSLDRAVEAAGATCCFHLAGLFIGTHRPDDVSHLVESNVAFGSRLAESLAARGPVAFVNAGTYWQHVGGEPYKPASLYAATKQAFEDILRFYADAGSLKVVSLRIFDTYGPDDPRPKLLNLLLDAARSGGPLDTSAGEQLIDLVHVDDVAAAFLVAANVAAGQDVDLSSYAVASGSPLRLRDLAAKVEAVTGRRVNARWGAKPYRPHEMFEPWDAGPRLPGWEPKIGLDDGLAAMWQVLDSEGMVVPR